MTPTRTIFFLCSGNYYRSRFAEILFNDLAARATLPWRADSAGLQPNCRARNPGPISPHAVAGLVAAGITLPQRPRYPRDATDADFQTAGLAIALKESEHRPLMQQRFPHWANSIRYWNVDDVQDASPDRALPELARLVRSLVREIHLV